MLGVYFSANFTLKRGQKLRYQVPDDTSRRMCLMPCILILSPSLSYRLGLSLCGHLSISLEIMLSAECYVNIDTIWLS